MSTSSLKLVNNLYEIYSKKCRDKNRKSECELKGLKITNFLISGKKV